MLLIYAVSPMALRAKPCLISMDCYNSDSFEIHSKEYGFMQHPSTISGLRYRPFSFAPPNTKAIHVVDLARQNWFEKYCWCSTTVYSHCRSCGTMTQSNRVDSADSVQLTRLLQCCMKLCNNEGGYTRPLVTARPRHYTAVRGSWGAHAAWTIEGS